MLLSQLTYMHTCPVDVELLRTRIADLPAIHRDTCGLQMYLHELEATSGTAMQPPRVPALLASKACRFAIMFGDAISAEQSAALVARLRQTRRFDICAHGRPTVAPLLDMGVLDRLTG